MWNRDTQCEMLTWNQTSISGRNFSKQHCRTCAAAGWCNGKKCRLALLISVKQIACLCWVFKKASMCVCAGLQTWNHWHLGPPAASSLNALTRLNLMLDCRWTRHGLWWAGQLLVSGPGISGSTWNECLSVVGQVNCGITVKLETAGNRAQHRDSDCCRSESDVTESSVPGPGTGSIMSQALLDTVSSLSAPALTRLTWSRHWLGLSCH